MNNVAMDSKAEFQLYKELVESASQSMFLVDKQKCITGIYNISHAAKLGPSVENLVGQSIRLYMQDMTSPFQQACVVLDKAIDNVLDTGVSVDVEYEIQASYLKATVTKLSNEQILIQVHDITDVMNKFKNLESSSYKELSMALTAGGLTSWSYDVKTQILSSSHNNDIIGEASSLDNVMSRILPQYRDAVTKMFDDILGGETQHREVTIEVANLKGYIQRVNIHAIPHIYNGDNEVVTIAGSQKDVTQEFETNRKMTLLNKQNELILNNINSRLVYITPDYKVIWENLSEAFGKSPVVPSKQYYKAGTFCYTNFNRDSPCEVCVLRRALESHRVEEMEVVRDSGIVVSVRANPIIGENDTVEGIVLRIDDITEKKRTFQRLKEAEEEASTTNELLQTILNNLPSSLFVKDADDDYRYIIANKKLCDGLGRCEQDVVGKTDYDIFPKEDADRYRKEDMETVASYQTRIIDGEDVAMKGGIEVWHTIKTPLIYENGENRKMLIGIGVDITENYHAYQELAEAKKKAEQSDKLKSAFLANMSHEIRTPLNAIVGFSELMQGCENQQERDEYMGIISANNELLLRLINDILDLSKLESGIVQLKNSRFDLATYFEELAMTMQQRITNPDIKFITVNPYKSCIVETDKARLTQVWHNFMTNAIKYTVSGFIRMGYEAVDNGIKIYVEDSGIGIAEDKKSRVFQRFEKLDSFAQGTGLGLSICRAITEIGGGKIGFDSTQGKGSLFWSWKPMPAEIIYKTTSNSYNALTVPLSVSTQEIEDYMKGHDCKILVAEDNDSNFLLIKHILKSSFNIHRVLNGSQAVDFVKNNSVHLVLMDIRMPVMDGLQATRLIREFNTELPIVALTANAFDTDRIDALESGCNDFIAKPVRKDVLLFALYKICKEKGWM